MLVLNGTLCSHDEQVANDAASAFLWPCSCFVYFASQNTRARCNGPLAAYRFTRTALVQWLAQVLDREQLSGIVAALGIAFTEKTGRAAVFAEGVVTASNGLLSKLHQMQTYHNQLMEEVSTEATKQRSRRHSWSLLSGDGPLKDHLNSSTDSSDDDGEERLKRVLSREEQQLWLDMDHNQRPHPSSPPETSTTTTTTSLTTKQSKKQLQQPSQVPPPATHERRRSVSVEPRMASPPETKPSWDHSPPIRNHSLLSASTMKQRHNAVGGKSLHVSINHSSAHSWKSLNASINHESSVVSWKPSPPISPKHSTVGRDIGHRSPSTPRSPTASGPRPAPPPQGKASGRQSSHRVTDEEAVEVKPPPQRINSKSRSRPLEATPTTTTAPGPTTTTPPTTPRTFSPPRAQPLSPNGPPHPVVPAPPALPTFDGGHSVRVTLHDTNWTGSRRSTTLTSGTTQSPAASFGPTPTAGGGGGGEAAQRAYRLASKYPMVVDEVDGWLVEVGHHQVPHSSSQKTGQASPPVRSPTSPVVARPATQTPSSTTVASPNTSGSRDPRRKHVVRGRHDFEPDQLFLDFASGNL